MELSLGTPDVSRDLSKAPGRGGPESYLEQTRQEEAKKDPNQQVLSEAERKKLSDGERERYDQQMDNMLTAKRNEVLGTMQFDLGKVELEKLQARQQLDNASEQEKASGGLAYNLSILENKESALNQNYSYEYARTLAAVLSLDTDFLNDQK